MSNETRHERDTTHNLFPGVRIALEIDLVEDIQVTSEINISDCRGWKVNKDNTGDGAIGIDVFGGEFAGGICKPDVEC